MFLTYANGGVEPPDQNAVRNASRNSLKVFVCFRSCFQDNECDGHVRQAFAFIRRGTPSCLKLFLKASFAALRLRASNVSNLRYKKTSRNVHVTIHSTNVSHSSHIQVLFSLSSLECSRQNILDNEATYLWYRICCDLNGLALASSQCYKGV